MTATPDAGGTSGAAGPPAARAEGRRLSWWWVALAIVLIVALVGGGILWLVGRPSSGGSAATSSATPSPSVSPEPAASPSPNPASPSEQAALRSYLSTVAVDGAAVLAGVSTMTACNGRDPSGCQAALQTAQDAVNTMQTDLQQATVPSCLTSVDAKLQGALSLYDQGLTLASQGAGGVDRLKVVQGAVLVSVGTWRVGVAIGDARQADCR